jgi:hypothetical protein
MDAELPVQTVIKNFYELNKTVTPQASLSPDRNWNGRIQKAILTQFKVLSRQLHGAAEEDH